VLYDFVLGELREMGGWDGALLMDPCDIGVLVLDVVGCMHDLLDGPAERGRHSGGQAQPAGRPAGAEVVSMPL
jgi:hypothetical protein